nr:MAG TPA: hypothetical protein [Herelleviridae sp.]
MTPIGFFAVRPLQLYPTIAKAAHSEAYEVI